MDPTHMSFEAHIKTGAFTLVVPAGKRAQRHRVHVWHLEGSV